MPMLVISPKFAPLPPTNGISSLETSRNQRICFCMGSFFYHTRLKNFGQWRPKEAQDGLLKDMLPFLFFGHGRSFDNG